MTEQNKNQGQPRGHKPASFAPYAPGGSPRPSKQAEDDLKKQKLEKQVEPGASPSHEQRG